MRVFVILGISVLFLVMHTQIAAQEIGRLFSTPAERVELDRLRSKVSGCR
jgi:hypothetical protein